MVQTGFNVLAHALTLAHALARHARTMTLASPRPYVRLTGQEVQTIVAGPGVGLQLIVKRIDMPLLSTNKAGDL
jgi:hypothetical protein